MDIDEDHAELLTGILSVCDPFRVESIEIPKLYSQEIYEELVKTPQWESCKKVLLNDMLSNRELNMPNVNIDDFFHFENVQLGVETLDTDDVVKFVQNFRNAPEHARFVIECREPMQHDLIRQKIETRWVGDWQQFQDSNVRFIIDPAKPDLIFRFQFVSTLFHVFRGRWSSLDESG